MLGIIQEIFLSPLFILVVLLVIFGMLTRWAVFNLQEYPGYGLGWLLGVFFIVVYSALVGNQAPPDPPLLDAPANPLNIFQIAVSAFVGFGTGIATIIVSRLWTSSRVRQSLKVATFTTLAIIILFMMVVSNYDVQRMIGIFALAFSIAAVSIYVIFPQQANDQPAPPRMEGVSSQNLEAPASRLDEIRSRMRDRR